MGVLYMALACAGCASTAMAFQTSLVRGAPLRGTTPTYAALGRITPGEIGCGRKVWTPTMSSLSRQELLKQAGFGLGALLMGATTMAVGTPAHAAAGAAVDVMRLRFGDKLRRASKMLDELQQDIFNDEWDLVSTYPTAFRALVPVFTKYTDAAFPGDDPVDTTSRVALRYEVGRLFGAVERLKRAAEEQNQQEAQKAYASMSVAYDRYLKAGNLYENYDAVTSTEGFYAKFDDSTLKFVPPAKDPPKIRDNVLMLAGPDKGKTGYMIGIETNPGTKAIIKLESSAALGVREIKVVPLDYVAKTLEQQGISKTTSKKMKSLS